MIGQLVEQFQIIEKLGSGGMGTVYKAKDTKLNRMVAIKALNQNVTSHSNAYKRFKNEAQISAQISHPNVASLYDFIQNKGRSYLIMELVRGVTLEELIMKEGRMDQETALGYIIQVLNGLKEAHSLGILHRDLKPSNIMISKSGFAKLMDFGIAKMDKTTRLTEQNKVIGTMEYLAPEIFVGKQPSRASDLYSIGVILYEMLTGKTMFQGDSEAGLMYQIVHHKAHLDSSIIDSKMLRIIQKLIAKSPVKRYRNADDLIKDLTNLKHHTNPISALRLDVFKNYLNKIRDFDFSIFKRYKTIIDNTSVKFLLLSVLLAVIIISVGSIKQKPVSTKTDNTIYEEGKTPTRNSDIKSISHQSNFESEFPKNEFVTPKSRDKNNTKLLPKNIESGKKETPLNSEKSEKKKSNQKDVNSESSKKKVNDEKEKVKEGSDIQKLEKESKNNSEIKPEQKQLKKEDIESKQQNVENPSNNNVLEKKATQVFLNEQTLPVIFNKTISSRNYRKGDRFYIKTLSDIYADGMLVVARSAEVKCIVSENKTKSNSKVLFAILIESVKSVNGEWLDLEYPEYSNIQKGVVEFAKGTELKKVKLKSQATIIYK